IFPNIIQPIIVQAAIGMAGAILAEATMSFLGLGVPPPTASWGAMLNDGRSHLFDAPHLVLFPALAVMLAVLAFNFIGDALRDFLDPPPASKPDSDSRCGADTPVRVLLRDFIIWRFKQNEAIGFVQSSNHGRLRFESGHGFS